MSQSTRARLSVRRKAMVLLGLAIICSGVLLAA
jgi:hypothetical protein